MLMGCLQVFQKTAQRLAAAIEKQNELAEKQSRRKLGGADYVRC